MRRYIGNVMNRTPNLSGCVLYAPLWRPNMAGSPFLDRYGNTLTVTGATWGQYGRACDGTDDKIDCGNASSLNITAAITLICWFKLTADRNAAEGLINKGNYNDSGWNFYRGDASEGYKLVFVKNAAGGNHKYCLGTSALRSITSWYHVAFTYDGTTPTFYLNGAVDALTTDILTGQGALNSNTDTLLLGNRVTSAQPLGGTLGEGLVYNRALSVSEIMNHRLVTKWRYA